MVRRNVIGASIASILLLAAGYAGANSAGLTDIVDAGADAAGGASGSYELDASGAYDVGAATAADGAARAQGAWDIVDSQYVGHRDRLRAQFDSLEQPAFEAPELDAVPTHLVQDMDAAHATSFAKNADLQTGLVDAKTDVNAWGHIQAFFSGVADAIGDALGIKDKVQTPHVDATGMVKAKVGEGFDAVDEARAQLGAVADTSVALPHAEPRLKGDYALQHAGSLTGQATGILRMP